MIYNLSETFLFFVFFLFDILAIAELLYSKYGVIGYVAIEYLGNWDALDGIPKLSALVSTYVQCGDNEDVDNIFNFILIFIVTVVVTVNYIVIVVSYK